MAMRASTSASSHLSRSQSISSVASSRLIESAPASAPVLVEASGALTQVCGSLVEPEGKRQQWACHGCGYVFPRDATIYATPASAISASASAAPLRDASNRVAAGEGDGTSAKFEQQQQHFCKACYATRFAMGPCMACGQAVLGTTREDGKFVKAGLEGHLWHGRCWACAGCGTTRDVNIGLDGMPTCESCFDTPRPRRHVKPPAASTVSASGSTRAHRPLSASALSGSASRQKMGATIEELSKRFGKSLQEPSDVKATDDSRRSSGDSTAEGRLSRSSSRSGSAAGRARPLTAQFSGNGFNLAAFQPTATLNLGRRDSRSRSASPTKTTPLSAPTERDDAVRKAGLCARCHRPALDGPGAADKNQVEMISLQKGSVLYHAECFLCGICNKRIDASESQTFIRLDGERVAHPSCAPPATVERALTAPDMDISLGNCSTSSLDHVTHQREPRPSVRLEGAKQRQQLPQSYLIGPQSKAKSRSADDGDDWSPADMPHVNASSTGSSSRRFQSTAGAAPPTRSTLLQRPAVNQAKDHAIASIAVGRRGMATGQAEETPTVTATTSSSKVVPARFARLGGMQTCGGCGLTVSSLESVPGPRGQRWHRKCLVCSAPLKLSSSSSTAVLRYGPSRKEVCGKALDSSAKVTEEGELRCRACYDGERARYAVHI